MNKHCKWQCQLEIQQSTEQQPWNSPHSTRRGTERRWWPATGWETWLTRICSRFCFWQLTFPFLSKLLRLCHQTEPHEWWQSKLWPSFSSSKRKKIIYMSKSQNWLFRGHSLLPTAMNHYGFRKLKKKRDIGWGKKVLLF